jgi:RNA polymerase sigma-70 factor (ECF subfamily)
MEYAPAELDELIMRAASGEVAAAESLLLHYHDPLLHFIQTLLPAKEDAELSCDDLLQEAMIGAFQGIRGIEARGNAAFFAWLKAVARTRFLNRVKANAAAKRGGNHRRVVTPAGADSTATSVLHLVVGPYATPSVIVRQKEAADIVAKAVKKLDPDRRRVIELRFGSGMSVAEVAAQLGRSEGAVKMLISRVLNELRAAVKADFKDFSAGA